MAISLADFPAPHIPPKLPLDKLTNSLFTDDKFISLLLEATSSLSEFIGYLQNLPNQDILITSLTLQESVLSSSIEGTIATIEDVVNGDSDSEIINNDITEINNYISAIQYGHISLRDNGKHLSEHLIKELHILLLGNNVRGANKSPGSYKTEQNYIKNELLGNFTPLPPFLTQEYMENLVTYLESPQSSKLIQIAIAHAQFEMVHPFKDGNGRVGRILIPLFLYAKDKIPAPIFYISRYFTQYNDKYKKYLSDLSKAKTEEELLSYWKDWLNHFLEGIKSESKQHVKTSQQIIELYRSMVAEINKTEMIALVDMLFSQLTIAPTIAVTELNLPDTSIRNELKKLAAKGYITRVGSARKTKYIFTQLIRLLN